MTTDELTAKLTAPQARAISAMMIYGTVTEAARAAGVGYRTLHRWIRQPAFGAALAAERRAVLSATTDRLMHLSGRAADELAELLTADNAGVRLRAAVAILSSAKDWHNESTVAAELAELAARLTALEGKL